uniref:Uncharacterized protein n=1 Tax=Timema douglasi TaxID=61478 RepID=A0A7R8VZ67_TIMDO|nr:unnamed protein product [Timema douglasi]
MVVITKHSHVFQFCSTRSTPARSHWRRQAGYGWPAQDPQFQNAQQNVNSNSPQGVDIRSEYAYHNSPNRPVQEFSQNENGFLLPSRPQPHHNGALHMSPSTNQVPDRQTTFEGTSQYRINSAVQHSHTGRNTETRCSGHVNDHINKVAESVQNSRASRQTNSRNSGSIVEQDIPPLWLTRSVDDCSPERNIAQRQAVKVPTSIQTEQQQRTPSFPPRSRLPTHDRQHESHRSRNNSQAQNNCSESSNHRIEQSTRAVPSNLSQDPRLDEGIIFPDSKQFIPNVANGEPSCANGTTFCVDLDNYPRVRGSLLAVLGEPSPPSLLPSEQTDKRTSMSASCACCQAHSKTCACDRCS